MRNGSSHALLRRVGHGGHGQIHLAWLSEIFWYSSSLLGCLCRISKAFGLSSGFRLRFGFGCLSQRWMQYGCLANQRALPNSMKFGTSKKRWTYQQFKLPPAFPNADYVQTSKRTMISPPIHQHEPRTSGSLVGRAYRLCHLRGFGFLGARRVNLSWKRLDSIWTPGTASR